MIPNDSYDRNDSRVVLVAENDDAVRLHISDYLWRRGFGVLEAKTSVEALLLAVEFPDRIDALFTSLDLRKYCNGAELAGCLRVARPEMTVFYLSGNGECSEEVARELVLGQSMLLRKPVSDQRMDEAVGMLEEINGWTDSFTAIERI